MLLVLLSNAHIALIAVKGDDCGASSRHIAKINGKKLHGIRCTAAKVLY